MSAEDRAFMETQTGRSSTSKRTRTHEERVRVMLGWIVLFTGIVAVATVASFISGVVLALNAAQPY